MKEHLSWYVLLFYFVVVFVEYLLINVACLYHPHLARKLWDVSLLSNVVCNLSLIVIFELLNLTCCKVCSFP